MSVCRYAHNGSAKWLKFNNNKFYLRYITLSENKNKFNKDNY